MAVAAVPTLGSRTRLVVVTTPGHRHPLRCLEPGDRVAIIANPKRSGGAERRLESVVELCRQVELVAEVLRPHLSFRPLTAGRSLPAIVRARAVPEVLAWDTRPIVSRLGQLAPALLVYQTLRSVHPEVTAAVADLARTTGRTPVQVIDYVDRLSGSYRQRARLAGSTGRVPYQLLAAMHARVERHTLASARSPGTITITAGFGEAVGLGAHWIPNLYFHPVAQVQAGAPTVTESAPERSTPAAPSPELVRADIEPGEGAEGERFNVHDAVFFGTLDYGPNVEALVALGRWVSEGAGPAPTVLVAGRHPTRQVRDLCRRYGWSLASDFPTTNWLAERARVAIAPLQSGTGIQNKVMEAAAAGMAQVVTSTALAGYDPGIPLDPCDRGDRFLNEIQRLANDAAAAAVQVETVRRHLSDTVGAEAVARRWARLLNWSAPESGKPAYVTTG